MKQRPITLRSSNPERDRLEEARQAEKELEALIGEFLNDLPESDIEKLSRDLNTSYNDRSTRPMEPVTLSFYRWLEDHGIHPSPYGSIKPDDPVRLLLKRLPEFDRTDLQRILIQPAMHLRGEIDTFLAGLTEKTREMVRIYASLKENADLGAVAASEHIPVESLELVRDAVRNVTQKLRASESVVKQGIVQRLQSPGPLPESSPVMSEEAAILDVATLRKVRIADGSLDSETTNAKFIGSLTDDGREMAKELLLLEDIRDPDAIKKLERKTGKSGYAELAIILAIRLSASPLAKKEICEAIKIIETKEEKKPLFMSPRDPGQVIVSPWTAGRTAGQPVERAKSPALSLPQILEEFTPIQRKMLLSEIRQSESNFDGGKPVKFQMLTKCSQRMFENGLAPDMHMGQLKLLLEGKSPTGGDDSRPFARTRKREKPLTFSPWRQQSIGVAVLPEIGPFADKLTPEAEGLLRAVVSTKNPDDSAEVERMIQEYAPGSSKEQFDQMKLTVIRLAKRLSRPLEDVREAFRLRLAGGKVLPEGRPGLTPKAARRAPTVLSSDRQKGILERLFRKKK